MPHLTFLGRALAALSLLLTVAGTASAADSWTVEAANSRLAFEATQGGTAFVGTFGAWTAEIVFDPQDLAANKVSVAIDVTSAATGDAQRDASLPTPAWFDASGHPKAEFSATTFAKTDTGYEASGTLTIRGIAKPVTLPFSLDISGDTAKMTGTTTVKRSDYELGGGIPLDMVGDDVTITVEVTAQRAK